MTVDAWGLEDRYEDALGVWRETSPAARAAILAAMGADAGLGAPPAGAPVRVLRAGQTLPLREPAELILEDRTTLRVERATPRDLPLGYHTLRPRGDGLEQRLIVSPGRCHLPRDLRTWGWAVQLYAARSAESWGIGDLADLRRLGRWSARELGAGLLLINPLHAATPVLPLEPSPYYPTSRRYRNPIYLRVEEVPGAGASPIDLEPLATAGRMLNRERRIDRDAVFRLKMDALERLWARRPADPRFDRYREVQGIALEEFATYCVLAERHGRSWQVWPAELRRADAPAVTALATAHRDRVRFHQWLQWLCEEQLGRAAAEIRVMQDLPIGIDPSGADAWAWQDVLALDVSVGAPPDKYITQGQDWGLPPFIPHRLRTLGYEPFIQTIRATMTHGGGLRIDHVMGLFRLYWIPRGFTPAHGAYVRYPADDLLAIIALESERARSIVVGEDLGTVETGVRERLAEHEMLSYRLVWFELDPPARYPRLALAAVSTHDLPTIAGLWTGADLRAQEATGLRPNVAAIEEIRDRLRVMNGLPDDASLDQVIERTHRLLAAAPSMLVTATLDDALGVVERPNMPSTTTQWPNWSLALPAPLEGLEAARLPRAIAATLGRRRPPRPPRRSEADAP